MSQTLTFSNYAKTNILEETELSADAAAAQATITVLNNQNFATNNHYVIGRIGSESLEKLQVLSVAGTTTITATANLARAHRKFDKVTRVFGNKIRVYRADNVSGAQPLDASFSLLGTADIDFDGSQTEYTDTDGSSDYWYKFTYYDSVGLLESALSQSAAVRGGGYGNYASIESIRAQAGLTNNRFISDAKIEEKRQAAQRMIDSTLGGMYVVPFSAPINPLISEITRLLAAGYLLTQEYGGTSSRMAAEGEAMIKRATNDDGTGLLDKLNRKDLKLTDAVGVPSTVADAGGYNGFPNSTTGTDLNDVHNGAPRMFTTQDRY